jgi:hypothetical protein
VIDRVIYVAGVPNGGTSCVAGILHHLGVDMGDILLEPRQRSYVTFEDRQFAAYKAPRFREYLEMRLENANGRRVGCKVAAWAWMEDPEPETLPIDVLIVRRPLEASMRSSMRLWTEDRAEQLARQDHPRAFLADKVAGVGRAFAAVEMLSETIEPILEIDFAAIIQRPALSTGHIAAKLGLVGSVASDFIDPSKVHYR